jgi:hypothetical protein
MEDQFEFKYLRGEALVVVEGPGAPALARSLFGELPEAGRLEYRAWDQSLGPAAAAWFPPDRLELRVPSDYLPRLLARLASLSGRAALSPFAGRVQQLLNRLEAWSYSDSDSGSGPAESMAGELGALAETAPSATVKRAILEARDALDDGLPAEAIAGTLERVVKLLQSGPAGQASGLEPSGSG